jgi:carboxyl-terminal processing protease
VFREADLRRHLVNETAIDNRAVEEDTTPDPRFNQTAEQVRAQGIEDFQLHYALQTVARLASNPRLAASMRRTAVPVGRTAPVRTNR